MKFDFPARANIALVGRTRDDCEDWAKALKPEADAKGCSLQIIAQLYDLEDMARSHYDVVILVPGMDPSARETVVWTGKRGNSNIAVIELPG